MDACDDLKQARQHLRDAAEAVHERVLGKEAVGHLRHALRSVLKAGISALDERDARSHGDRSAGAHPAP